MVTYGMHVSGAISFKQCIMTDVIQNHNDLFIVVAKETRMHLGRLLRQEPVRIGDC